MAGIGPATSPLPRECSTTEPHGREFNFQQHFEAKILNTTLLLLSFITAYNHAALKPNTGAGDEARTRDIQFGKLKLYQLSYTRAVFEAATN